MATLGSLLVTAAELTKPDRTALDEMERDIATGGRGVGGDERSTVRSRVPRTLACWPS